MAAGSATAAPGTRVEVAVRGSVACDVTGFSFALGHDATRLRFVEARPGPAIAAHAGEDLVFASLGTNQSGYAGVYALFDISVPITVPPIPLPDDTILATFVYDVLAGAPAGPTPLLNRTRTYGSPNPIANVYAAPPGAAPIDPLLIDGEVLIDESSEPSFLRGDANRDDTVEITDPTYTLNFLFLGGPAPSCLDAADADDDGEIDLSDPFVTLLYLFESGPPTPPPGPVVAGVDPTADVLDCTP